MYAKTLFIKKKICRHEPLKDTQAFYCRFTRWWLSKERARMATKPPVAAAYESIRHRLSFGNRTQVLTPTLCDSQKKKKFRGIYCL